MFLSPDAISREFVELLGTQTLIFSTPNGLRGINASRILNLLSSGPFGLTLQSGFLVVGYSSLIETFDFASNPAMVASTENTSGAIEQPYPTPSPVTVEPPPGPGPVPLDPESQEIGGPAEPAPEDYTVTTDSHEFYYDGTDVLFVNTNYSCISKPDSSTGFNPVWQPPWINELKPEDRCHLNGMCYSSGSLAYVTAASKTNTEQGWREVKLTSGVVWDVVNEVDMASGLCMPHSPTIHNSELWFLNSGAGELCKSTGTGTYTVVATVPGFARGLVFIGNIAFVGTGRVRDSFNDCPIAAVDNYASIQAIDITTSEVVGQMYLDVDTTEVNELLLTNLNLDGPASYDIP